MQVQKVIDALASLAQETRLAIFRRLVQRGPEGLSAGTLADKVGVPSSSLSFHLQHLLRAGLVTRTRHSRKLVYAANFESMNTLVAYLTENCCGGASCSPVCATPRRVVRRAVR